jgi:hypothetical protein
MLMRKNVEVVAVMLLVGFLWSDAGYAAYRTTSFAVDIENGGVGGMIVCDVDSDGDKDIVLTEPGRILAYDRDGTKLWRVNDSIHLPDPSGAENPGRGQPGHEGPGVVAGDVDQDGVVEVLYVDFDNRLRVIDGRSGAIERTIPLPAVTSYENRWGIALIANFRGLGDIDILLGAEVAIRTDYLRTKLIRAYAYSELASQGASAPALWSHDDYICLSHGQPIVADLDRDGRDEVVGGNIIDHSGVEVYRTDVGNAAYPHFDSLAVADVDPGRPGLECVAARERPYTDSWVYIFNKDGLIHKVPRTGTEPDKVQVGDYDPAIPGLEIWTRGEDSNDMQVWDRDGNVLAAYDFDSTVDPPSWSDDGVESYHRCRWTGGAKEYMLVSSRGPDPKDVGIFDPLSARFLVVFGEATVHALAADIQGDWREEVLSLRVGRLFIYENTDPNPNPGRASLWSDPYYAKSHQIFNYYNGAGGGDLVGGPPSISPPRNFRVE